MKKILLAIICSLFSVNCYLLSAFDYGLILNQYAGFGGDKDDSAFEYKAGIVPRIVFPAGENGEVIVSASFTLGYDQEFYYYPELLRTEYSLRTGSFGLRAGRISYSDVSGYVAQGLFDGFQVTHASSLGRFSLSGMYTGFIFKKSAYITMTGNDRNLYDLDLDYGDFFNTYFGSRRILGALDWEHPAVGELVSLKVSVLGQFDLNDTDETINSQYFILRMGLPVNSFFFDAGCVFSTIQRKDATDSFSEIAFALDFGINWILPTSFYSRLALSGNYTSPLTAGLAPFASISTFYAGDILQTKRTALTAVSLDYSARINDNIGIGLTATYFVRNDITTGEFNINGTDNNEFFLGPEVYARLIWSPFSDLQINLGGGAFFPSLGNNWTDAGVQWKIELTASLAVF